MSYATTNHRVNNQLSRKDAHYARMLDRKQALEQKLEAEMNHVALDWDGIRLLKRKKLALNEQLQQYLRQRGAIQ